MFSHFECAAAKALTVGSYGDMRAKGTTEDGDTSTEKTDVHVTVKLETIHNIFQINKSSIQSQDNQCNFKGPQHSCARE